MKMNGHPLPPVRTRFKFPRRSVLCAMLISFASGSLVTARLTHVTQVSAGANHVFELMIYHTVPGKARDLEAIFREDSKLMAKHGVNVIGFWVPNESPDWKDTFVYVVDFPSRDEAKKRWAEFHADPDGLPYVEAAKSIIQMVGGKYRVDEIYMRPSDFSALK